MCLLTRNIFIIAFLDEPIVLSKAISPDLALTSIIIEDIILKAQLKLSKSKLKTLHFFQHLKH